jgi:hypothetical protein
MNMFCLGTRTGFSSTRKQPGFTAFAVGTIELSVGATAAIFGVVDAVMLRSPRFREAERVVNS